MARTAPSAPPMNVVPSISTTGEPKVRAPLSTDQDCPSSRGPSTPAVPVCEEQPPGAGQLARARPTHGSRYRSCAFALDDNIVTAEIAHATGNDFPNVRRYPIFRRSTDCSALSTQSGNALRWVTHTRAHRRTSAASAEHVSKRRSNGPAWPFPGPHAMCVPDPQIILEASSSILDCSVTGVVC